MAALASENMSSINGYGDDLINGSVIDVPKLNNVFLMSLLEESQTEEYTEEQVDSKIRSLEAEINHRSTEDDRDSAMEPRLLISNDVELMDGQNCLGSLNLDYDFAWDYTELVASSPSEDSNLYMDSYEMDFMVEFDGVIDCSQLHYVLRLEDQGCFSSVCDEVC